MKGKIKEKYKAQFNPWFNTTIMGQPTKVSLKDAENKAENYVNSPIAFMYEDLDGLKKKVERRMNSQGSEKIDMNNVERGDLFDPEFESHKQKVIKKFKADQQAKAAKIKRRLEQNIKALADAKKSQEKAVKAALAKAKKEQAKANKQETEA